MEEVVEPEAVDNRLRQVDTKLSRRSMSIENGSSHLDPSRWWFASSAFPMAVGTLGPVASAFSICALVQPWIQRKSDATFLPDPIWLTVVNSLQLALAIVSNIFLSLNMARRISFSVAQPVTIVGWKVAHLRSRRIFTDLLGSCPGTYRPFA